MPMSARRRRACAAVVPVCVALALTAFASGPDPRPWTFRSPGLAPVDRVPQVAMPPVDVPALLRAAAERPRTAPGPLRVGEPFETDIAPDRAGAWETLPGGDRVWRVAVHSDGALWIVLGFGTFRPAPGAELRVFDPAGHAVLGPYTAADERWDGQLWTPPVYGSTLLVELFWPHALAGTQPLLHLGTVSHGYVDIGARGERPAAAPPLAPLAPLAPQPNAPLAGACEIDIMCPLGANWQNDQRGVVNLLSGGSGYCSGSLITNTGSDCRNYVLTAHHCLGDQGTAASTTFQFNYERPLCGSGTPPSNHTVTGSDLRATYSNSDFTLLEISSAIPAAYKPYYNGWSRSTTPASEAWGIHHPNNDEKKISHSPYALADGSYYGPNHWRVTWWSDGHEGVTEPGSSGSPLFDPQHRIVGQLHGGYSACNAAPSDMWDEYGKVLVSWTGGGSKPSRLSDWLDPGGTGAPTADGLDATICANPGPRLAYASSTVSDPLGNGNGAAEPGERFTLAVTIANTGTVTATHVAGTLSTTTPKVTILDAAATWPDVPNAQSRTSNPPHFLLQTDPTIACGTVIALHLVNTASEAPGSWPSDFSLTVGHTLASTMFEDDMEAGPDGWVARPLLGTTAWQLNSYRAASPTHSWGVIAPVQKIDTALVMPQLVNLPAGGTLTFQHVFQTENSYDGGVLEYTADGTAWIDAAPLFTSGGYSSSIAPSANSTLAGRSAWAGDSGGWKTVTLNLDPLAGKTVQFRWRFATNDRVSTGTGWSVDDVIVTANTATCDPVPPGEASDVNDGGAPFTIRKSGTAYALAWSTPVYGTAPSAYKLYRTPFGPLHPSCEADLGGGTSITLPALTANRGFLVVARNAAGEGSYGQDSSGAERLKATGADLCP